MNLALCLGITCYVFAPHGPVGGEMRRYGTSPERRSRTSPPRAAARPSARVSGGLGFDGL